MHTIQGTPTTPRDDVYKLANVIACWAVCDVDHATIGLTNLAKYSVQRFLHSFISF